MPALSIIIRVALKKNRRTLCAAEFKVIKIILIVS
jgi:hypothetical protein